MRLVESHIIDKSLELDELTFKTKNLYNAVNYIIRQEFISNGNWLRKLHLFTLCKDMNEYTALPVRVSRCVIRMLDTNWTSFFEAMKSYKKNKNSFRGRPNLPNYLDKNSRFTAIFIDNGVLKRNIKNGYIGLSSLKQKIKIHIIDKKIIEVQVVPYYNKIKIQVVYEEPNIELKTNNKKYCSVDLGVNNLMTITSNIKTIKPLIINGRPLKSINQYYNKKLAKLKSLKATKQIQMLGFKKTNKVNTFMHQTSRYLIDYCGTNKINTIVIGHNHFWKQKVNMGKVNNQKFVSIPFDKLIQMIKYKALLKGINIIQQEESYTSKCSFLDMESVKKQNEYSGRRVKRGLFVSKSGKTINADVNGSYNILRKAVPNVFDNGIEDVAVHPNEVVTLY